MVAVMGETAARLDDGGGRHEVKYQFARIV
jgi:hypothetical protein